MNKVLEKIQRLNLVVKKLGDDKFQILSIFIGLIMLLLFFTLGSPFFLTTTNLYSVSLQIVPIVLIAIGQTYVLITAGIDLSIAPTMAFSGVITSLVLTSSNFLSWPVALVICMSVLVGALVGCLIGWINGLCVVYGKLPPFIVTMGMLSIVRGLALLVTKGRPITFGTLLNNSSIDILQREHLERTKEVFEFFGNGKIFGFPFAVIVMIILAIIFSLILSRTRLGAHLYATGSNINAARLSGVNTNKTIILAYMISGLLAALAGIIAVARILSAGPNDYVGYELFSVASSVIGGTSLSGGQGLIGGTVIGAFIIGFLRNGLNLMRVSPYTQQVFIGLVIIVSVYFDKLRRKNRG